MQLRTIKTLADIPADMRASIELIRTDNAITGIVIGGKLRCFQDPYSFKVAIQEDHRREKRQRLTLSHPIFGDSVKWFGEYETTAANAAKAAAIDAGATGQVEVVEVFVDDNDMVVGAANGETVTPVSTESDLPF